jgi:hypothetical protein
MPTTVSHEALPTVTAAIVADVADPSAAARPSLPTVAESEVALARLRAMSSDVRGGVLLAPDGTPLAASGDPQRWGEAASQLLAAADAAAGEPVTHAHVGTEDGEAFAVRQQGFALVAATERFALASLIFSDIRAVLRDLVRDHGAARNGSRAGEG